MNTSSSDTISPAKGGPPPSCPVCGDAVLPDGFCPACAVLERDGDTTAEDAAIAALENSPFEPEPIAQCFATPLPDALPFTLQTWIDLEALHSTLLLGGVPELEEAGLVCAAFGLVRVPRDGAAVAQLFEVMRERVRAGFSMVVMMKPAESRKLPDQGFGTWLPLLSKLMRLCGMTTLREALGTDVGQAYALVAAAQNNDGWLLAGSTPYHLRALETAALAAGPDAETSQEPEGSGAEGSSAGSPSSEEAARG